MDKEQKDKKFVELTATANVAPNIILGELLKQIRKQNEKGALKQTTKNN